MNLNSIDSRTASTSAYTLAAAPYLLLTLCADTVHVSIRKHSALCVHVSDDMYCLMLYAFARYTY